MPEATAQTEQAIKQAGAMLVSGRIDDARTMLLQCLKTSPNDAAALAMLGQVQHADGDFEGAVACLEKAIELGGEAPAVLNNLAIALKRLDRTEDAIRVYQRALSAAPDNPDILCNIGSAYISLGRGAEAERLFRDALRLVPNHPKAQHNLGLLLLGREAFEEGWDLYRQHEEKTLAADSPYASVAPFWHGEPLAGARLLVWRHQGVGDELLYASMLPDLIDRGVEIEYRTEARMMPLLERSFPGMRVALFDGATTDSAGPPFAAQSPVHLLGAALQTAPGDFPKHTGYLKADTVRTAQLRAKYSPQGGPVIGLSWRSKAAYTASVKSSDLADWQPVLAHSGKNSGARFVSLQYGDFTEDIDRVEELTGVPIIHDPDIDQVADIDGFAAQVAAMDLVISTSNTTVHMAGALGIPVWTLLPHHGLSLWYWFDGRNDCPWYPSMRVFRQAQQGDWRGALERVGSELPGFLRTL